MCLNQTWHTFHFLYHEQQLNSTYWQQQLHFMHYHNALQCKDLNIKTVIILSWICMSLIKHALCLTHYCNSTIDRHWGKNSVVHTQNTDPSLWLCLPKHHCLVLNMDRQDQWNGNGDMSCSRRHQQISMTYCPGCT